MRYDWIDEFLLEKKGCGERFTKRLELDSLSNWRKDVRSSLPEFR